MHSYLVTFMVIKKEDYITNITYGDHHFERRFPLTHDDLQHLRGLIAEDFKTTFDLIIFTNIYKFEMAANRELSGYEGPRHEWGK